MYSPAITTGSLVLCSVFRPTKKRHTAHGKQLAPARHNFARSRMYNCDVARVLYRLGGNDLFASFERV